MVLFCLLFVLRKLAPASPRCVGGEGQGLIQLQPDTGRTQPAGGGGGWLTEGSDLQVPRALSALRMALLLLSTQVLPSIFSPQKQSPHQPSEGAAPVGMWAWGSLTCSVPKSLPAAAPPQPSCKNNSPYPKPGYCGQWRLNVQRKEQGWGLRP